MIRNQLVASFRGQDLGSQNDCTSAEKTDAPTNCTKDPGLIKLPANKESVLVIKQICLHPISNGPRYMAKTRFMTQLTTIDIPAACTMAESPTIKLRTVHPFSRKRLPPERMTKYVTTLMPCKTIAKDMRNPTDRHMEQKYRSSPWQSSRCGKLSQVSVMEEQRRWRP